jgi:hypothetical protein
VSNLALRCCLYRRFHGMQRWVGLSVIADNVIQMGRWLALQGIPEGLRERIFVTERS